MDQQIIVYPHYIKGISILNTDKNKKLNDKTKILSLTRLKIKMYVFNKCY